jgi:hypothetical protein
MEARASVQTLGRHNYPKSRVVFSWRLLSVSVEPQMYISALDKEKDL